MKKHTFLFAIIGLGVISAALFLIKIPVISAQADSKLQDWILANPNYYSESTGIAKVPLGIWLIKGL